MANKERDKSAGGAQLWKMMERKNVVPSSRHVDESNISTIKTGGQDYVVHIAIRYRLDSVGIVSWWGQDYPCSYDWPQGPPSLLYNGCQVFTGSKVTGMWC